MLTNDYMGTTLTAGVRRLPSAEEMVLMQGLVAQAKANMAGSVGAALAANDSRTFAEFATLSPSPSPASGGGEFPTLPLGTSFIGFLGLLRSSRYGGVSIVPDENTLTLSPNPSPASGRGEFVQYDWAANATLNNGSLNAADSCGAAVLREVSTSQTRLSQVFQLNPTDRFLSFTLSGAALDDMNGAPDDAFEVALLDANTGASLLGGTGQTRSDAFLNLQADGTQTRAGYTRHSGRRKNGVRSTCLKIVAVGVPTLQKLEVHG